MKKGIAGLLLFTVICLAACHKTIIRPTISQQFSADSTAFVNYFAANHINAIYHDSIWYTIREAGTGPFPTRFNCVLLKYTAYELPAMLVTEGTPTPFQTSTDAGLKGPLKGLISGMQIGLKKFPTGTKGTIYIPSYLGYGPNGRRDQNGAWVVHPNTPLVFDMELVALSDYNVDGNYCYE